MSPVILYYNILHYTAGGIDQGMEGAKNMDTNLRR